MTEAIGAVAVVEREEPPAPGPGEVLLTPAAVGICGSDYHFFLGELSDEAGGSQFPRVLGHEVGARIAALGPDCRDELAVGQLIALWPLIACGRCYPCRVGRPNTCDNFKLIGIHLDGGLQQQLVVRQDQVFPIAVGNATIAALVEPLSIAVQAVNRAGLEADEAAVVLGAGPIGQCITLVARDRGARVLAVDIEPSRLVPAAALGAETLVWTGAEATISTARQWAGSDGPPVVFDATGAATAVHAMLEMVSSAGRAVQVGMSNQEVSLRVGLLTEKELDMLGVSCCDSDGFAEAVEIAERNAPALARMVSHEFPLARFPEALRFAIENPTEVLKVVILSE
ncbi:MAG TPA: alcohol dehydrogenase catalytic domain-containing protein [Solirubrobacteraceae bacterium]|nr:alcohol dehydrogenase catalytic domain-containing protein [Solirubrobacteraceae bacterium]